jgi:uncharacterized protein YbaR (Trm112 family)
MSSLPKEREDLKLEACSEEVCNIQTCLFKNDFALERYVMFVLASPKEKQFLQQNPEERSSHSRIQKREEVLTSKSRGEKFSQANPEERSSSQQNHKREVFTADLRREESFCSKFRTTKSFEELCRMLLKLSNVESAELLQVLLKSSKG